MSEGDTIRYLSTRIGAALAGQRCVRCVTRDPRLVGVDLVGSVLRTADAFGKHLFVEFDDVVLHAHLGMTGSIAVSRPISGPAWKRRIELGMEHGSLVGYNVPILGITDRHGAQAIISQLGPDLCGSVAPEASLIVDRLRQSPEMPLAAAILDQRIWAGFGNVYAIELPFIAGICPTTPIGAIDDLDLLVRLGIGIIRYNATTGMHNTTGKKLREDDRFIFGGRGGLCPICGSRLDGFRERESPWQRQSVWCTSCQTPTNRVADRTRIRQLTSLHPGRIREAPQ